MRVAVKMTPAGFEPRPEFDLSYRWELPGLLESIGHVNRPFA